MPDQFSQVLVDYALGVEAELPEAVQSCVADRVLDTVGAALGALDNPAVAAVGSYVAANVGPGPCVAWGLPASSTVRGVGLLNATAVRCLDQNDTYNGRDGFHPSEMIPGLIALGEMLRLPGAAVAAAIAVGYEVSIVLADASALTAKGWDNVNGLAIGACCAAGRLLGLTGEELANALALTVVPHAAMRLTRTGNVTMWKSIASAMAVANAIDACMLARAGVCGPGSPFLGAGGYFELLSVDGLAWGKLSGLEELRPPSRIGETHTKAWPSGQLAQSAIDAAVALHAQLAGETIESVVVTTFQAARDIMGDAAKWKPSTRETADHSLPYAVAAALADGRLSSAAYSESYLSSQALADLVSRVSLVVDPQFTGRFPAAQPASVEVVTASGRRLTADVEYPKGHAKNPMSADELMAKFTGFATPVFGDRTAGLAKAIQAFSGHENIGQLTRLLASPANAATHQALLAQAAVGEALEPFSLDLADGTSRSTLVEVPTARAERSQSRIELEQKWDAGRDVQPGHLVIVHTVEYLDQRTERVAMPDDEHRPMLTDARGHRPLPVRQQACHHIRQ
jgi:2-methylcitrate dehydratase